MGVDDLLVEEVAPEPDELFPGLGEGIEVEPPAEGCAPRRNGGDVAPGDGVQTPPAADDDGAHRRVGEIDGDKQVAEGPDGNAVKVEDGTS